MGCSFDFARLEIELAWWWVSSQRTEERFGDGGDMVAGARSCARSVEVRL